MRHGSRMVAIAWGPLRLVASLCLFASSVIAASPASAAGGALDVTFGGDGKVNVDLGSGADMAWAVAIQDDDKIVLAGQKDAGFGGGSIGLVRLNSDGTVDTTFGDQGLVVTGVGAAFDVAIQDDGKIVVAGSTVFGCCDQMFLVARFNDDGSPDQTFSDDGVQTADFGPRSDVGYGLALQDDGKIVVVGWTDLGSTVLPRFAVLRFGSDGVPDTSFDGDGAKIIPFGRRQAEARSVAIQSNGRIVVAGYAGRDFALLRLKSDGTRDATFSRDGKTTIDFRRGTDRGQDVAIQPNGRIVVAGEGGHDNFAVARLMTTGVLDPSFSGDGKQETAFAGNNHQGQGVQIQTNGKIVVAGVAGERRVALARYKRNGKLDSTFSGDGRQMTRFNRQALGHELAIQPDGRILVVGTGAPIVNNYDFIAARYLAN